MSIIFDRSNSKLVYRLYAPSAISCVNFVKVRPVVLPYLQFKLFKTILFRQKIDPYKGMSKSVDNTPEMQYNKRNGTHMINIQ